MKIKKSLRIYIDDLSSELYNLHLNRKNYRICRVLRLLSLRNDFVPFLERLKKEALHEEENRGHDEKIYKIWHPTFEISDKLTNEFLDKVIKCRYIQNQSEEWIQNFLEIAHIIINHTYLDGYANEMNGGLLKNMVFFDDKINYPNIKQQVYDKDIFWKIFNEAFYSNIDNITKKYGKHPMNIVIGGNKFNDNPNVGSNIKPTEPKICQIIFDDTTEKQELIDYIDKSWNSIEGSLKALRPDREEKRITGSGNFIRDVDIYNRYQSLKEEGIKNPDTRIYSWLMTESTYKLEVEPNTVRKIVSLLKTEVENINTEK